MAMPLTGKRILILDHVLIVNQIPIHGPGLNLFNSFKSGNPASIEYFAHCLDGQSKSYYARYEGAETRTVFVGLPLRWVPAPFSFGYGVLYSFARFVFSRHDLCIAVNPLNFLAGYLLRACGRVGRLVSYAADYSERRFSNRTLNTIYHALDRFSVRHADQVWSVSQTICDLRRRQGVPEDRNHHIPNSPVLAQFRPGDAATISRSSIAYVFGGSLRESDLRAKHHFDWLFEALGVLARKCPHVRLLLIGRGDFKTQLESLIPDPSLLRHIDFLDIEDRGKLIETLCHSAIGVAFYDLSGADHLRFGDSMKIREYFAAGLPAVTTPGHSVAAEVQSQGVGFVVRNVDECVKALDTLLQNDDIYFPMRQRVLAYAAKTDKSVLIESALARLMPDAQK